MRDDTRSEIPRIASGGSAVSATWITLMLTLEYIWLADPLFHVYFRLIVEAKVDNKALICDAGSNCWPIFRWNLRSDYGAWVVRNVPTSTTSDLFVDILTSCNRSKVTCTCASSLFPLRTEAASYAGSTTKNIYGRGFCSAF
jgi:hypothetical protein